MEMLKNAGDLGGRQNVRVYCKPIKILSDIGSIMRPLLAIFSLLLCLIAARAEGLPVIKDSEAVQYLGKNVEVRGLVVSVTISPLGTACISFGRENILIRPSLRSLQPVQKWRLTSGSPCSKGRSSASPA